MNLPATSEKRHPFAPTSDWRILREGNTPGRQSLLDDIPGMDWFVDGLNLVVQALHSIEDLYAVHMYLNKMSKMAIDQLPEPRERSWQSSVLCAKVALDVPSIE
jgi:hypothetical protein